MRVRALSPSGDMTFGRGSRNFLVDSAQAVAQVVRTRLLLWQNEWFIDLAEGTPWATKVLGTHTVNLYDQALTQRILTSPGVLSLESYSSSLDARTRVLTITGRINTQFGPATIDNIIPIAPPARIPLTDEAGNPLFDEDGNQLFGV